jgi:hypothetical protein
MSIIAESNYVDSEFIEISSIMLGKKLAPNFNTFYDQMEIHKLHPISSAKTKGYIKS